MRTFTLFCFTLLFCVSCRKEDTDGNPVTPPPSEPPPPPADVYIYEPCDISTGVARASKLGNDWVSGAELIRYEANDTLCWYLNFLTCNAEGSIREDIFLGGFTDSNPKGTYPIVYSTTVSGYIGVYAFSSYALVGADGDLFLDYYKPDTSGTSHSYLEITRWDTIAHIAEGRFNLAYRSFFIPTSDPKHYEFMEFSNGRFWAKIPE